ncbi:ABC-type branched-chain amino acid transport systems, ATPase component [Mesorhizobium australicum WSM2073]|uniref:ABC-type branched-chain amino acid transport systems, ATPase component n=1 Tax=Mesorhizobium australicum (strain HAMBI 3006 / LMG 24608 / WSM2073) TaxID=754035 RepID=L0KI66_MESAW|nr:MULTISPECIES: ABC transporter ATP-binding protein [Mesorhizobium]AGB43748.1 ABC-type branched-chain amino acid transport systems, ATPase component [Mesorhizobium australicum WSM2073]MBZ9679276.1 ATP-binding cassette domain-containing protein [Mesorhizobium sp. CO1-1-2]MBZ9923113.1 ATP-binding cassette domain-containing protein [Mesorhizobium sp. BR1-1-4]TPM04570.1 ATP-binding cassette domain-containing protein [Mesorhizobium sp. B2-3-10]
MNANAQMNDAILQVDHLSMKFGGLVAIGDLSFTARRGEITALIGPNGAGKTTVFNCITGFYKPSEGMITLNRADGSSYLLERLPNHEIPARAKVARTFQNIRLFSGMTLLENLLVAQHNKLMKASGYTILGLFGFSGYRKASAESVELAKHWLEKADLVDRADDPAGDLPYGAQRRLEIARAMCTGPELLCLDEPAAGLNPKESAALNELLMGIKHTTGTSILLIEHDMSVVMQISDHVVVLEYGRKISDGNPQSVRTDPRVIAAYLGVDDEEVETVLTEVGDEDVIEQLDIGPDSAHGPGTSSSYLAGPVSDTVGHSQGERVTVSKGASKAAQVDARGASVASRPVAPTPAPAKPAAKKAAPRKTAAKAPAAKAEGVSNRLAAPRGGKADNLTRIKGIGTVNEKKLNEHGIFHFDQIGAWKKADVEAVEAYLAFDGRIAREEWVKQAKLLGQGKDTEFSRRVDAGKVATSHVSGKAKASTAKPVQGKRGGGK